MPHTVRAAVLGFLTFVAVALPFAANAKTVQWSTIEQKYFYYHEDWTGDAGTHTTDPSPLFAIDKNLTTGPVDSLGLENPSITVTYNATITNADTGTSLSDGDTVPVGTHLTLTFTPHVSNDIYWFGTGFAQDSPYGSWNTSMAPPALSLLQNAAYKQWVCLQGDFLKGNCTESDVQTIVVPSLYTPSCDGNDYVGEGTPIKGQAHSLPVYMPLVVAPPAESLTGVDGLSCGPLTFDANHNGTAQCTVTNAGTYAPVFNFGSTSGKFYFREAMNAATANDMVNIVTNAQTHELFWLLPGGGGNGSVRGSGCYGNNIPMAAAPNTIQDPNDAGAATPYTLAVPAQTIPFTFKAGSGTPPKTPSISCPSNLSVGQSGTFDIQGTDASSVNVHYGIDWTNSGSPSEWAPASGYVPGGTKETVTHSWNTAGTYKINAYTQDDSGNMSQPGNCTVTVSDSGGPVALLTADPSSIASGGTSALQWTCANSATASIDNGVGTVTPTSGGSKNVSPSSTTTYTLTCTDSTGATDTDSATVTVGGGCTNTATCELYCPNHPDDPACKTFCDAHPSDPACSNVSALLTADPLSIVRGYFSTLTWSSVNAVSCSGTNFSTGGKTQGTKTVSPLVNTLYTLTCQDLSGNKAYSNQNVLVTTANLSVTASPSLVRKGDSSVISWSVLGQVDSCTITGPGLSSSALLGSSSQVIGAESTYTLSCNAGAEVLKQSATVKITPGYKEI